MQPGTVAASAPNPALVFETLMAHQRTAALKTAIELDLFRAVGRGSATAASLAEQCAASERGMRILCDFLTIIELLAKQDGLYCHTPPARLSSIQSRPPRCTPWPGS